VDRASSSEPPALRPANPALDELIGFVTDLQRAGQSIVLELARAGPSAEPGRVPPTTVGVFDPRSRWHVYYHSHPGAEDEAGHVHALRRFGRYAVHVVGISMDLAGWPRALFTLNLWCLGEPYETAATLKRYARSFRMDPRGADPHLSRFLTLIFRAFLPEIEWVLDEKIRALATRRVVYPARDPFADRSLEVPSRLELRFAAPREVGARRLPPVAEPRSAAPRPDGSWRTLGP
jgi:hypothetical protein